MIRFRLVQHFAQPHETVGATYRETYILDRQAELPKVGRPQLLSHEVDDDILRQKVRYAFAGDLSAAVRRVVDPARLTWIEDSTSDRRTHRTEFRILPDHYAKLLHCSGTFTLRAKGSETTLRLAEGEMKVSVPFVGGKVERAIVSGLEDQARGETELVETWADRRA
ncbi:MAG: DUF2505 domain-containing protein [Acidimicrobiales bacterium]